jgi:hypothetical protein
VSRRKATLLALATASLFAATTTTEAHAGGLPVRAAKLAWDKSNTLRATFSFPEAVDDPGIRKKLYGGLKVSIVMRGYVYPVGGGDPVALTAHTCDVAYDLWNEVFKIIVDGRSTARYAVNLKGVHRACTELVELPVVERASLRGRVDGYYLAVKVEVNPVSTALLKQVQSWVTRPVGQSGAIAPGDALFSSFVGIFMKKLATADYSLEFETAPFPS